jgi:tRNA-dihydrouridine synthase
VGTYKRIEKEFKNSCYWKWRCLTPEDTKRMFEETGCNGVMIGRGAIKNPFIFVESFELIENGHYESSNLKTKIDFIEEHIKNLEETFEEQKAIHFAKVFIGKVTKGIQGSSSLRNSLSTLKNIKDLRDKIEAFKNTILKEE